MSIYTFSFPTGGTITTHDGEEAVALTSYYTSKGREFTLTATTNAASAADSITERLADTERRVNEIECQLAVTARDINN